MRYGEHTYEMPAVVPALQEYDWTHEHEHEIDDVVVMWINTEHLPTHDRRPEPARKDN